MPKIISKSAKNKQKKLSLSTSQLPEVYNKLLEEYVVLLQAQPINPYEFSIKKRFYEFFDIKGQLDYVTSSQISNFINTPDTLAQELPLAKEMLKKLDRFDDQAIKAITKSNNINLFRLRRRSIRNQIIPALAFTGSVLGLFLDFQDILAISIKDIFAGLSGLNISSIFQVLITIVIFSAVVIAYTNVLFTSPRIGLVDAFGDICQIMMVHRNLKE